MTRKPRQIIGSDPLAAIPKDYNRYCDRIIGNAGSLFLEPEVVARANEIIADGGTVEDIAYWDSFVKWAKYNPIMPFWADIVAAHSPSWGVKGIATASKLYSIIAAAQDIDQTIGSKQPTITAGAQNGKTIITCDGISQMLQGTFTFVRPETVVLMGFKQISWTNIEFFFDGNAAQKGGVRQVTGSPTIEQRVGGVSGPSTADLAVNTAGHLRCLFNHPTSNIIQVDNNAEVSLPIASAVDMDGFTIGARGDDAAWSNESTGGIVLLNAAVDANYSAKMDAILAFGQGAYATP